MRVGGRSRQEAVKPADCGHANPLTPQRIRRIHPPCHPPICLLYLQIYRLPHPLTWIRASSVAWLRDSPSALQISIMRLPICCTVGLRTVGARGAVSRRSCTAVQVMGPHPCTMHQLPCLGVGCMSHPLRRVAVKSAHPLCCVAVQSMPLTCGSRARWCGCAGS